MTQIAQESGLWTLLFLSAFIPFIGFLGSIALAVVMVWLWWKIAERRNRPGWWGILMLIPFVNLVLMGFLAWDDKKK